MKKMLLSLLFITNFISTMENKFSVDTPIKMPSAAIIRQRILNRDPAYDHLLRASSLDTSLGDREIALIGVVAQAASAVEEYNQKHMKGRLDSFIKWAFEQEIIWVLLEDYPQEHKWLAEFLKSVKKDKKQ